MSKYRKKHVVYYLFLFFLLAIGVFLGFETKYDRQLQIDAVLLLSLAYATWGILHHMLHHDLTLKIVIEYVLMGLLGVAVTLLLLKGGI